jgi:hypothetical protein
MLPRLLKKKINQIQRLVKKKAPKSYKTQWRFRVIIRSTWQMEFASLHIEAK